MPKTPTRHRTVRTWINGVLRETLESENQEVRVTEPKVNTEMAVEGDPMEAILRRMEQLEMENARNAAWRRDIEAKDKGREFAQTWENNVEPEIHDPISRVQAMLEEEKKTDGEQFYLQDLQRQVAEGKLGSNTLAEISKTGASIRKRILGFREKAPKYDGKPEKVFSWCESLEEHLSAHDWESIPNEAIKKMLLGCITGPARQEIVLLQPPGAAFEHFEIGEFFAELLKKFSQEKDEEGRKQEYMTRKQGRNEDPRKYYTDKMRLWIQAYAPARRSLVEFKTAMILGLYNAELRKTCLMFMPKVIQHESEIKAVLDHQLVNLRTYNTDPRAPAQDLSGLRSTYSFESEDHNKERDMMLKTGQVPMEVNEMPGLVLDESEDEETGGINALQGDNCFWCKKPGHQKKDCRSFSDWKKKNPDRKPGTGNRKPISCYNCGKPGHISRECRGERQNQGGERRNYGGWNGGNGGGGQMADMRKSMEAMQEIIKQIVPDAVFP